MSCRVRYYSPTLQRFISEDPLGFGGGDVNLYAYAGNSPTNFTDPSGQFIELAGQCVVGAAVNVGFGYFTSKFAGRKYTAGDAARDGAIGCAVAVIDPLATAGEAVTLAGDVVAGDGAVVAADAGSALASAGEDAATTGADSAVGDATDEEGQCSFSGDTPVSTTSGETAIDQIQPGYQVEAYDPATGQTGPHTVTAVWQHTDPVVEHLTIDGEQIDTTPNHLFYIESIGWVPAGMLWNGAVVRRENGQPGIVQQVVFSQHAQVMYNLTVDTVHTYFVGYQQVLVHNCAKKKTTRRSQKEKATDIPSFARGQEMQPGETPDQAAKRIMDQQYGEDNWSRSGQRGREYSQIKKHLTRGG